MNSFINSITDHSLFNSTVWIGLHSSNHFHSLILSFTYHFIHSVTRFLISLIHSCICPRTPPPLSPHTPCPVPPHPLLVLVRSHTVQPIRLYSCTQIIIFVMRIYRNYHYFNRHFFLVKRRAWYHFTILWDMASEM